MGVLGAKTRKLVELKKLGFKVPPFLAISSDKLQAKWNPETLSTWIQKEHPCSRYAVRSSAALEDGQTSSFAGQFLTELNVTPDGLAAALKKVRDHASKFLKKDLSQFSILVQEFIEPDHSGVTFTRNPNGGREMVIEYHKGRGEDLVSGKIKPTQVQIFWHEDAPKTQLPRLPLQQFKKIEQHFKFPQDIEWCVKDGVWYFLQTRPITTLSKKDYELQLFLDRELPKKNFYFAKTEISEIAPRPDPKTLSLLKKIFGAKGPVQKVYKKHHVHYQPQNFLTLVDGELYVNKETELKTLLPSYSYFPHQTLQPKFVQLKGSVQTLKNIARLNLISPKNTEELFQFLNRALTTKKTGDFLRDYEVIFEINLLAGIALKRLEEFLKSESISMPQILENGTNLFPELQNYTITFECKSWKGNSLDFSDTSPFQLRIKTLGPVDPKLKKWWSGLPTLKKTILKQKLFETLLLMRLREYGRCLIVKHLNQSKRPSKKPAPTVLPTQLMSFFPIRNQTSPLGVSPGIAQGSLTLESELKKTKGPVILYTKILSPHLVQYFDRIQGIVSEEGGLLSHLAIMAREHKIPVVTQVSPNNLKLKIGDFIQIDGSAGII